MSSVHHQFFICAVLYACLCLTVVQLAPAGRWTRGSDDDKENTKPVKDGATTQKDEDKDETPRLFEGDIMLTESQKEANKAKVRKTRNAEEISSSNASMTSQVPSIPSTDIHRTWPNGRVPYKFGQLLDSKLRMVFVNAMDMIREATCITFDDAKPEDDDYLLYEHDEECMSFVGWRGGPQKVTIADRCSSPGHALHEIGHALGLWHEHSRPDRDEYIEIIYKNLESQQYEVHFRKTTQELFKSVPPVEYDIQSVMHYSQFAFASTVGIDKRTIRIREDADLEELMCTNRLSMGQRSELSYKDKLRLNLMYQCTVNVTKPECILPTPTPTTPSSVPPELASTDMPMPSSTIAFVTPTPLSPRLRSGNVITLSLVGVNDEDISYGMKCVPSPGCTPLPCRGISCQGEDNQFHIVNHKSKTNKIKSGATVLLRSVNAPSNWLDCSGSSNTDTCIISTCREDNVEDPQNASYISSCSSHHFKVFGVGRGINKVLNVNHKLQFRDKNQQSYLSCNGKKCKLRAKGECPNSRRYILDFEPDQNGECSVESFRATKLSEY